MIIRDSVSGASSDAHALGIDVANRLLGRGAGELLAGEVP